MHQPSHFDSTLALAVAWAGNALAWLWGPMSPLQGLFVFVTLIFTLMKAWVYWRDRVSATRWRIAPVDSDDE